MHVAVAEVAEQDSPRPGRDARTSARTRRRTRRAGRAARRRRACAARRRRRSPRWALAHAPEPLALGGVVGDHGVRAPRRRPRARRRGPRGVGRSPRTRPARRPAGAGRPAPGGRGGRARAAARRRDRTPRPRATGAAAPRGDHGRRGVERGDGPTERRDPAGSSATSRQRTRGDHAERPLAPDEQRRQVVAGVVLQQPARAVDARAVGQHRLQAGHPRAHRAVAQRADAACVGRRQAADGGAVAGGEVDARVEPGGARVRLQRGERHPGAGVDLRVRARPPPPSAVSRAG